MTHMLGPPSPIEGRRRTGYWIDADSAPYRIESSKAVQVGGKASSGSERLTVAISHPCLTQESSASKAIAASYASISIARIMGTATTQASILSLRSRSGSCGCHSFIGRHGPASNGPNALPSRR